MPPTDPSSRPSPWLAFLVPLLISATTSGASFAVQWGTLGADNRHLEQALAKTDAQVAATNAALGALGVRTNDLEREYVGTRRQMETELAGLRREMERMARALERLTEDRPARAHR